MMNLRLNGHSVSLVGHKCTHGYYFDTDETGFLVLQIFS